jgi:hypothetical protein
MKSSRTNSHVKMRKEKYLALAGHGIRDLPACSLVTILNLFGNMLQINLKYCVSLVRSIANTLALLIAKLLFTYFFTKSQSTSFDEPHVTYTVILDMTRTTATCCPLCVHFVHFLQRTRIIWRLGFQYVYPSLYNKYFSS